MFNKKLKEEIIKLKLENETLDKIAKSQEKMIVKLKEQLDLPLPEGCVKGEYCKNCAFVIKTHIVSQWIYKSMVADYDCFVCGKDKCKEFVERTQR